MRKTLIFLPAYELQMMYELRKCGLIKCCNKEVSVSEADEMMQRSIFRHM